MRIAAACLVLLGSAGAAGAAVPGPALCGAPGKAACPLQAFMRDAIARPYATRSFDALASSLERLRELNPNPVAWGDWDELSADAVRAARGGDETATMKACSRCHRSYRRAYLEHFRDRPLRSPAR